MDKHQSKIIILVCLLISAVIVFFALYSHGQPSGSLSSPPPVANVQASQLVAMGSPDGKLTLTMKQEKGKETTTYTFLIADGVGGSQKEIFTKTISSTDTLSIPYNTFSPDNKYIFLKETNSAQTSYFVLTTSGAPVTKDAQTLDILSLFTAKYPNYVITDATGWAGPTLVVINTNKSDGSLGPSFWFDAGSQSFIQLSERFN